MTNKTNVTDCIRIFKASPKNKRNLYHIILQNITFDKNFSVKITLKIFITECSVFCINNVD